MLSSFSRLGIFFPILTYCAPKRYYENIKINSTPSFIFPLLNTLLRQKAHNSAFQGIPYRCFSQSQENAIPKFSYLRSLSLFAFFHRSMLPTPKIFKFPSVKPFPFLFRIGSIFLQWFHAPLFAIYRMVIPALLLFIRANISIPSLNKGYIPLPSEGNHKKICKKHCTAQRFVLP